MDNTSPDRIPPSDLSAEQATLGAMLTTRKACVTALGIVSRDDFYREAHRDIYAAIHALQGEGEIVDPITVASALNRSATLTECGGVEYLRALMGEVVSLARVNRYATIVHDLARLRRIATAASEIAKAAYVHRGKPEELLRQHLSGLQAIAGDCNEGRTAHHTSEGVEELGKRIAWQRQRGEAVSPARFGLPWFDKQLNGLRDWGMVVCRGDTKFGKSLLVGNAVMATCLALVDARDEGVVLAYILEAREEWEDRCIAWLSRIDKRKIEGRLQMTQAEEERYENALRVWSGLPLLYTDRLSHIDDIRLDIEQQAMKGNKPALIVVDHFQRVIGEGDTATIKYDDAAQKLAAVPREHGCPVLVPSQVTEDHGVRHSMWARRLDQEATVVFDILGERDSSERILRPTLPRKFVPFGDAKYYIGSNFDARLWDAPTYEMMQRTGER